MDALFPPTPKSFHNAMWSAVDRLSEQRFSGTRRRVSLIAAALILAMAGVAYAAVAHFGVLDQLSQGGFTPIQGAESLVTTEPDMPFAMAGDVKFEVTETAYDGEQIFISVKMSSDKFPVQGVFGWSAPGIEGSVYCNVYDVYVNGVLSLDFQYGEASQIEGESFGMINVPYKGEGNPVIKLDLGVRHEDTDSWDTGELTLTVPTGRAVERTMALPEPVTMNGVTVQSMEMRYSMLKLYTTLTYTIDPSLPRFERMRREYMYFELTPTGREIQERSGMCGWSEEEQAFVVKTEAVATDESFDSLTVALRGEDREVYWEQTVNFKEDAK